MNQQRVTRQNVFGAVAAAALGIGALITAAPAQAQTSTYNGVPVPDTFFHRTPPGLIPRTPSGFFPPRSQSAAPQVQPAPGVQTPFLYTPRRPRNFPLSQGYLVPQGYTYFVTPQGFTAFPTYNPYLTGGYYVVRPGL